MHDKPLWQCPRCERYFFQLNQPHSCGKYTVEQHLARKSDHAAINKITDEYLDLHLVLSRRIDNPRFRRIEVLLPRDYVHHLRISSINELDMELAAWLCEAYQVGTQERLRKPPSP